MASLSRWAARIFEEVNLALAWLVAGSQRGDVSTVLMLHLLFARRRLKLLGDNLAQRQECLPTIHVRQSLPELVQIQCRERIRLSRRGPPFCHPCIAVLLEGC